MHVHILGICGTFMAGIAALARELGYRVTGSDAAGWPPMSTQLERLGIDVMPGYEPAHLDPAPDMVVVGNVISRGNPAIEHVLDAGLPYQSGPQWLAEHVLADRWVLAVAGTHGKTTTSSMLAWILEQAGESPGFLIGGVAPDFGISARLGSGRHFVIEADEYDTAFFDKRSKFLHYRPRTLLLNNLEYDHADIFPDLAAIQRQFHHLVRTVPGSGCIVWNGEDANLKQVLEEGCWSRQQRVMGDDAEWQARLIEDDASRFSVWQQGQIRAEVRSGMPGLHNLQNALGAIACAADAGVEVDAAAEALNCFSGVKRRLELRGEVDGVRVYDDFAHHPTAVESTLNAMRARGEGRVLAVLEPRSNTMRMGAHRDALAACLGIADRSFVYAAPTLEWDATEALGGIEHLAISDDIDALVKAISGEARSGDQVVIMSNGDFGGIHDQLLKVLRNRVAS